VSGALRLLRLVHGFVVGLAGQAASPAGQSIRQTMLRVCGR